MNMCGYQFVAIYDDEIDAIRAGNQKTKKYELFVTDRWRIQSI